MTQAAKKVLDEALRLPEAERMRVVEGLLAELDGEADADADAAWAAEIERRGAQIERGEVQPVPWAKVKKAASIRSRGKH